MPSQSEPTTPAAEEQPPLGSWRRMYAVVLVTDLVLIGLFTWFTVYFQ